MYIIRSGQHQEEELKRIIRYLYEGNSKRMIDECLATKHNKYLFCDVPGFGPHGFDVSYTRPNVVTICCCTIGEDRTEVFSVVLDVANL